MYVLPMGAGKTVMALTAATDLLKEGAIRKVLVVAPIKVSEATWPDEFGEWEHLDGWPFTLIRCEPSDIVVPDDLNETFKYLRTALYGKDKKGNSFLASIKGKYCTAVAQQRRLDLAREDTPIHIINIEAVPWLWAQYPHGKGWPYDMLILDESTVAKNGRIRVPAGVDNNGKRTMRLSRFGSLVAMSDNCYRHIVMTGTPVPRMLGNIWGQIRIVDGGKRLGKNMTAFHRMFFDKGFMAWDWKMRKDAPAKILRLISDVCVSLDEKDLAQLPPVVKYDFKVKLPPKIMAEYKKFRDTLVSEEYDVEAPNKGVLHSKLLQFANGSVYKTSEYGGKPKDVFVHDEKLKALQEIVAEIGDEPVLVAYTFKFDLERIKSVFKDAVVFNEGDARKIKAAWNEGKIKMLLGHPASIGHGQNLQYGGRNIIWYGLTSDLELYQQFNKRLNRRGQTRKVYMYRIIAKDTIDEKLLPVLDKRAKTQQDVIDKLRV